MITDCILRTICILRQITSLGWEAGQPVVFTHWSSINFFTVCVSEAVAHVELVEFGLKSNLKFYNFGQVESYV